ncbi:flagellar biosynthesis protein FlhB [Nitrospirillum sp. BR 11752]|uniref:flagellar biosynthesis protein FlhB n=1 Tax=Nitrospirillum sp. BR 11752 TaxID=3104293 RepID=UPI002EB5BDCB|nr:flagellar biosynthesis protein FlhB [Nitrospirillum sp. BR 11752]
MSEDQDPDSKTEEPTGKRLTDARSKGNIPKSQEVPHLFMLGAILVMVVSVLPWTFGRIHTVLIPFIERPETLPVDRGGLGHLLTELLGQVAVAMSVPFALLVIAAVLGSFLQVGFVFSFERVLSFDLNRFNIVSNLLNKFKVANLLEFAKSLIKLVVVSVVVLPGLFPLAHSVDHFIGMPLMGLVNETKSQAVGLIFRVLIALGLLAGADWWYQRWKFMRDMRMTKQEVKDEHKQTEGDPLIKGKIRALRMQRARNRMMENVPKADVVVTNPTHYAIALKYDPLSMGAPMVVAKGVDFIAARIRELAEEHGIPLVPNPPLARALYASAEVDEEIPAEHYKAVAQVISYVFKLKKKTFPKR